MSLFQVHRLNADGMLKARALQGEFEAFLASLEAICGVENRDMAIVRTKLQEASFFAKRAMAVRPENQEGT